MDIDTATTNLLVEILKFYGDRNNWQPHFTPAKVIPGQVYQTPPLMVDGGQQARDILRKVGIDLPDEIAP